jgi:hypothetical protein
MDKQILNLLLVLFICFIAYYIFRNLNFKEGLENNTPSVSSSNGIAGSAQNYAANIKSVTIKNLDELLISKYRSDYENTILNVDDLINTMMLKTVLNIDNSNPMPSFAKLNELNTAKTALNNVMKFVDSTK